jgi:ribonuclease PH
MLPGSTPQRKQRDGRNGRTDGRSIEIQRLIGRSLRSGIDLDALPEVSLWVDCDVLSADGGTRTWAITGAWIALHDALTALQKKKKEMEKLPILQWVTATSVGLVNGQPLLDLCYQEDSNADVDMNVIYTSKGEFAEVQMSGEKATLGRKGLDALLDLAEEGCKYLLQIQEQVLETRS